MWELDYKESWTPKNWCFWTVVLGKHLRVLWTARRSNQSILKEISPEYLLEGLMLKLKLQYFGHLMQRTDSFEKTLMLGKIEGRRRRGWQRMRWLDGITYSMVVSLSGLRVGDGQEGLACCDSWGHKESDRTEQLNWTELTVYLAFIFLHIPNVSLSHLIIPRNFYEGHYCPYFIGEETEVQRVHEIIMVVIRVDELGRLCRRKKKIQNTGWCLFARGGG